MLNGMGLVGAGSNAERLAKSMMPVITLNGIMCFLFALALVSWPPARTHPGILTALAATAWIGLYGALEKGKSRSRETPPCPCSWRRARQLG